MKALIAATCVSVLLAVGYFFYWEYQAYQQRAQVAEAARLSQCEDTIVGYQAFRNRRGDIPKNMSGPEEFQNVAAQCAKSLKEAKGYDIVVTAEGAVMN